MYQTFIAMPKKSLSTKEKLLAAATELFIQKGVDRVGVREIAAKAGINLSLMNYYFQSKERLLEHIFENIIISKATHLKQILDSNISLEDKIKKYTTEYIDVLIDNPLIVSFFLAILHRNPEKIVAMASIRTLYNSEVFCKQLEDEMKAGRVRQVDPEQVFICMVSLIIFPFAIKDLIMDRNNFSSSEFNKFGQQRKEVVSQMVLNYIGLK